MSVVCLYHCPLAAFARFSSKLDLSRDWRALLLFRPTNCVAHTPPNTETYSRSSAVHSVHIHSVFEHGSLRSNESSVEHYPPHLHFAQFTSSPFVHSHLCVTQRTSQHNHKQQTTTTTPHSHGPTPSFSFVVDAHHPSARLAP